MGLSTNRSFQLQLDNETVSKLKYGKITDSYIYKGRPFVDVVDTFGNIYNECNILGIGGDEQNWSSTPIKKGMEVILLPTGYNSHALVLGSAFKPATLNGHLNDNELGMEPQDIQSAKSTDHQTISMHDLIMQAGDKDDNGKTKDFSYLHITPLNGIVLETTQIVRIQLPEDGILRISSNRQIVDEPLNGQQFINVVTPFFQSLVSIEKAQGDVLTIFNTALNALNDTLKLKIAPPPGLNQGALPVTNAELAGYIATLSEALSSAVADLAATNFIYDTLEHQQPTDELKPKMEATINRKIKLPK
jgi:hypothetical protein